MSTTPIAYVSKTGRRMVGYDAELLPMVCEAYLKFRDACGGNVPKRYIHIVTACDMLRKITVALSGLKVLHGSRLHRLSAT